MNARKEMRARIEELNTALEEEDAQESEDPDEEEGINQNRLNILAEIQELEHKLDEGSGDDD
jgi:hypothetical protein